MNGIVFSTSECCTDCRVSLWLLWGISPPRLESRYRERFAQVTVGNTVPKEGKQGFRGSGVQGFRFQGLGT